MDNKDFSDIGGQIRRAVENAVRSRNFEQLNKEIGDSVNDAINEARTSCKDAMKKAGSEAAEKWTAAGSYYEKKKSVNYSGAYGKNADYVKASRTNADINPAVYENFKRQNVRQDVIQTPVRVNYPSRVAGILFTVFGSIGFCIFGILSLLMFTMGLFTGPFRGAVAGSAAFLGILAAAFGGMLFMGRNILLKIRRLKRYLAEAGERRYCTVEQLSAAAAKPQKFVKKDLSRMISSGLLPEAHLDDEKTCLMLDRETYRQYQETRKNYEKRRQDESELRAKKAEEQSAQEKAVPEELKKMISSGKNYVRILREANDAIPGEQISEKLSRLETVISGIFETVEKHPEQMDEMERFMEYYLPTTVKLVNAYRDFDSVNTAGDNVESAKAEIENTLDTINQAFERLLDHLYEEAALDASTDASVLQTILKNDGFAESDFGQTGDKK